MYRIRTVLVPTDFSEWSRSAYGLACDLARAHGGRVILLHVYPPPIAYGEVIARREPDGYEEALDSEMRTAHPAVPEVPVTYRLAEGDPEAHIRSTAAEERCDLIVLGTHGRTGMRRLLMGSVAEHVLRQSPCPVLTVNRSLPVPAEAAAEPSAAT